MRLSKPLRSAVAVVLSLALVGAMAASRGRAASPPLPITSFSGATIPARLASEEPRPIGLSAGFTSAEQGGGPAPELSRIEIDLSRRVSLRPAGRPLCPERLLFKTSRTALEECGGSLVGGGRIASDIPVAEQGSTVRVEGEMKVFYGLARGEPMLLARVETGQPMPLVYVIPFAIETSRNGDVSLVAHKMTHRHGKCAAGYRNCFADPYGVYDIYSRIAEFELSLYRGHGRSGLLKASCPSASVTAASFSLERIELRAADGRIAEGRVRGYCR